MSTRTTRIAKGWTEKQVLISARGLDGGEMRVSVNGFTNEAIPGLAITPSQSDARSWCVTHVASGRMVTVFHTRSRAVRCAERIAPLTDWTQSAKAIWDAGIGAAFHTICEELWD